MGADFATFVPSVRKPMLRHHVQVCRFSLTRYFLLVGYGNIPIFLSIWMYQFWRFLVHFYQHNQFDALEARLKRREPAYLDVHFAPPTSAPPVIANGNLSSSVSFHNLDWDGEVYDSDSRDPNLPLQVYWNLAYSHAFNCRALVALCFPKIFRFLSFYSYLYTTLRMNSNGSICNVLSRLFNLNLG